MMKAHYLPKFLVLAYLAVPFAILTQTPKPLTNDDVIQMVKGDMRDEMIIKAIQTEKAAFDTSGQGLVALKNAGVSDKVVTAILDRQSQVTTSPQQPAQPPNTPV